MTDLLIVGSIVIDDLGMGENQTRAPCEVSANRWVDVVVFMCSGGDDGLARGRGQARLKPLQTAVVEVNTLMLNLADGEKA